MNNTGAGTLFRSCAACGDKNAAILHKQRFVVPDGYPLPGKYDVVSCNRCGFVFADTAATQDEYNRFYSEWSKYDDAATSTGSGANRYDAERLRTTAADFAQIVPSRNIRIFDAGCAGGGLLLALRDLGFTAAGLDPSAHCSEICKQKGFEAYTGTITTPPPEMPQFDCLVLSHVLEHVRDIPEFFAAVRNGLKPGGYLYLETPDAARYADYLYAPFQEFNTEHINHFSGVSLENVARRFGFEPLIVRAKLLQTSEKHSYPAVFGIFRLPQYPMHLGRTEWDETLISSMPRHIKLSRVMMEQIGESLVEQLKHENAIILWGAGQLAMKLLDLAPLRERRLVAVLDSNPILHGKQFAQAPVMAPEALTSRTEPVVISCSYMRSKSRVAFAN